MWQLKTIHVLSRMFAEVIRKWREDNKLSLFQSEPKICQLCQQDKKLNKSLRVGHSEYLKYYIQIQKFRLLTINLKAF